MPINPQRLRIRRLEAAQGYLALDMPDHALREMRRIDNPQEVRFDFCQLKGEALRQKRRHEEALNAYRQALEENPDDLGVLMGMAWCYKRLDQLPRAIQTMEQAYQAAPREPVVLYNLACYFALAGDKTQALSWLGRAIRMEPALRQLIPDETDFDPLRNDSDFQFIVNSGEDDSTRLA